MISLTDDELSAVMSAAAPLRPCDRDPFLRALAQELSHYPRARSGFDQPRRAQSAAAIFRSANLNGGTGKLTTDNCDRRRPEELRKYFLRLCRQDRAP